jgi:hypothetical protein
VVRDAYSGLIWGNERQMLLDMLVDLIFGAGVAERLMRRPRDQRLEWAS